MTGRYGAPSLAAAMLLLAVAGCQQATIGPRGGKHLLSRNVDAPAGSSCIAAWVDPESQFARDIATAEPPVHCSNNMASGAATGAFLRVGHTFEGNRYDWQETNGPGLMAELVLYDSPLRDIPSGAFDPGEAVDWSMLPASYGRAQALDVTDRVTIGGHEMRVVASVMPWDGEGDHLVCVASFDVTTHLTWTRICRPGNGDATAQIAQRIIADDLPAVRIWPKTTWSPPA